MDSNSFMMSEKRLELGHTPHHHIIIIISQKQTTLKCCRRVYLSISLCIAITSEKRGGDVQLGRLETTHTSDQQHIYIGIPTEEVLCEGDEGWW